MLSVAYTLLPPPGGGGQRLNKFCEPKVGLQFGAPLISLIFYLRSDVGGSIGVVEGPKRPGGGGGGAWTKHKPVGLACVALGRYKSWGDKSWSATAVAEAHWHPPPHSPLWWGTITCLFQNNCMSPMGCPLVLCCHVHVSEDQNREALFSELTYTSFSQTRPTPRTSETVSRRHCCARRPFYEGACAAQGPSPDGVRCGSISYTRRATEVMRDRDAVKHLAPVRATSPPPAPKKTPAVP